MFEFDGQSVDEKGDWRHRLTRLGFIWGAWTLVGLFYSSQIYFYFVRTERPVSLAWAAAWQLIAVYLFALFTPPVLWLARRYRIERLNWRRNLLMHFLWGTLISAVLSAAHVTIDSAFGHGFADFTLFNLARRTFFNLDKELLVYWLLVLISHAFNYYQRYREGELRASQAQLQALKMQLHPHFLFNTLHSISALVHKDPDAADRMISRLGDFLRLTLENSGNQEVTLQKEVEFLKCYLEIERVRFQDRLTTRMDIDARTLDARVPYLILQPIVENAIRHGIAPRSSPGRIEILAKRDNGSLRIQVKDNGPGLPDISATEGKAREGLGLANTRARLRQLYGPTHRFELHNDPAGGLVVTLEIPVN